MKDPNRLVKINDQIINVDVKNGDDEYLGVITDVVLDRFIGQALYVVLDTENYLINRKLFAVPWNSIYYEPYDECFILNVKKEQLHEYTGFDRALWPEKADLKFSGFIAFCD